MCLYAIGNFVCIPVMITNNADRLISICDPGHRALSDHLSQCKTMRSGVRQVSEVLKNTRLIGKVRSL